MIKKIIILQLSVILFFIHLEDITAQAMENHPPGNNIKIGLALSGGGALGIAHIGVLKAFEEEGIPIDIIAGTSMGSIVGGLYASGYSSTDQLRIVQDIDWVNIFDTKPQFDMELIGSRYGILEPLLRLRFELWEIYIPSGFNNGQSISNELFRYTSEANFSAGGNFDNLSVPYRAIAVDTSTGKAVSLGKGELAQAIRASMAIPMVFHPTRFNNRLLIDGGVLNNLPTDVVSEMGADIVIASDVNGVPSFDEEPRTIAEVAEHTMEIAFYELIRKNIELADFLIEPDLRGHQAYDFSNLELLIEYGYEAAMASMDQIKKIIPKDVRNRTSVLNELKKEELNQAAIKYIKIFGLTNVREAVVTSDFSLKTDETYNTKSAIIGIEKVYATGLFENVWLELDKLENNNVGINIHVIEKYPRTLGFGLNYQEQEGVSGFFQIIHFNLFGWGERFMPFLRYGDIYKKAGVEIVNDRLFSTPVTLNNGLYYENESPYLYDVKGSETGQFTINRFGGQFSIGAHIYKKLLLMAGVKGERIWLEENAELSVSADTLDNWKIFGKLLFDNTDDKYFPHKGVKLLLVAGSMGNLSSKIFTKLEGQLDIHIPVSKRQTISSYMSAGTSLNGLPVFEIFKIGGPYDLPGYHRDELWIEHLYTGRLNYSLNLFKILYYQTSISISSLNDQNVFANNYTIGFSTGLMLDFPLGPVSLSYGWSEENREQIYFSMGFDF